MELNSKKRIIKVELAIEHVCYNSLKFTIWTRVGIVVTLSGGYVYFIKYMIH